VLPLYDYQTFLHTTLPTAIEVINFHKKYFIAASNHFRVSYSFRPCLKNSVRLPELVKAHMRVLCMEVVIFCYTFIYWQNKNK
jgi:hypothetical protein